MKPESPASPKRVRSNQNTILDFVVSTIPFYSCKLSVDPLIFVEKGMRSRSITSSFDQRALALLEVESQPTSTSKHEYRLRQMLITNEYM